MNHFWLIFILFFFFFFSSRRLVIVVRLLVHWLWFFCETWFHFFNSSFSLRISFDPVSVDEFQIFFQQLRKVKKKISLIDELPNRERFPNVRLFFLCGLLSAFLSSNELIKFIFFFAANKSWNQIIAKQRIKCIHLTRTV